MILSFEYEKIGNLIVIKPSDYQPYEWSEFQRIISDYTQDMILVDGNLKFTEHTFISIKTQIGIYLQTRRIRAEFSEEIKRILQKAKDNGYNAAINAIDQDESIITAKLEKTGFIRKLTPNQMANVCHLASLPSGATFSVPGAGKTTEALAFFFCNAKKDDQLLVVGPLSAMGAWEEQLKECCPGIKKSFVRLRGGEKNIARLLSDNPRFMSISYGQFANVSNLIKNHLTYHSVFMFLDESHRIKSGRAGVSPQEILKISHLPTRKLILSGTPCPQAISDLLPQFEFLYPDYSVDEKSVVKAIQPIYVRTTKDQLGIPKINFKLTKLEMDPLQKEIYKRIRSETARQLSLMLSNFSKSVLRDIGKKIIKVMEFTSNPSLLAGDIEFVFDENIGNLLARDNGVKIDYACKRARELANDGNKVIIWSQFVKNVQLITERLQDLGADCIYGSVKSGDEQEEDTREWKIKEFHENPNKMVLVLNPAAASEAISLHKACKYAIYVDRSFNAAHFLQSEDRIHRLGIKESPTVEILECRDTIDQVVAQRLDTKIRTMANALNDNSLKVDPIPYDIDFSETDMDNDDIRAVMEYFGIKG